MYRRLSFLSFVVSLCGFGLSSSALAATPSCTLSKTNQTVTICTPANGATVPTTFHVNAGATDSNAVSYIGLWVNTKPIISQNGSVLDATVTLAAGSNQRFVVQAVDSTGASFKTVYAINVSGGSTYSISPQNPTVSEGGMLQFTASTASTWSATCGSIDGSGNFTAPLTQPNCSVTGTATDGSGNKASTSVNISSPITISPGSASTTVNGKQQFSANVAVNWAASCGTIDSTGLFTAPGTAGSCTITATASSGTPYTAEAQDTVTSSAPSGLNYTTWKNDNARDGLNAKETLLTPSNVNSNTFGQVFSTALDARVWAQPLYMSQVTIGGAKHNVVYVATANDTVYAVDGDRGGVLWSKSLLVNGEKPGSSTTLHSSVQPIIGITGTPVIDAATGTLYAVTHSGNSSGTFFHRLHALDISTGAEKFGGPVVINTGGWDSSQHLQRPGLLLTNGNVYIAFSSNEDVSPYHGWIFAYGASTLNQVAVWNDTLGAKSGGIWMGAAGVAADSTGNLFVTTGNGDWNGSTQLGQSAVKLNTSLAVLDYFTPINHSSESAGDKDLGSAGITLLPTLSGAPHPHEAVGCSKLNVIYVYDRDNMGQIGSSKDDVVQQVTGQLGGTTGVQNGDKCFTNPAFWNNNLYFIGNNDVVKQFTLNTTTGLMSTTPVRKGTFSYPFPAAQPVVSSNGNSNAIVWAFDWKSATLHAYNASTLGALYTSGALGTGIKWATPTVVNGHVYVGLQNKVVGFGLKSGSGGSCSPPASPGAVVCAPVAGQSYSSPVTVQAAGKPASGTLNRMEIWIDGTKINDYFSSTVNTTVSLATGSHALTAVEVDSTGAYLKSPIINFTVH